MILVFAALLLAPACRGARHLLGRGASVEISINGTSTARVGHPAANAGWTVNPFMVVGSGSGKAAFYWAPGQGALVSGIDVWAGVDGVNGIAVTFTAGKFTEGSTGLFGSKVGAHSGLVLSAGEKITEMTLWDNGLPSPRWAFGAMKIVTDAGQTFDAGVAPSHRGQAYVLDVGSGFVVGVSGHYGSSVNAFGACFLKPVISASLEVDAYPTLQDHSPAGGKAQSVLATVTYSNFGDEEQHVRMTGAPTLPAKHLWTCDASEVLGVDVPIRAGVPRVVETDGVPSNWTVTDAVDRSSDGDEEEVERVYDLPLTVGPHSSVDAKATLAEIDLDIGFTGRVGVIVDGGAKWTYRTSGRYQGLAYAFTVSLGNVTPLDGEPALVGGSKIGGAVAEEPAVKDVDSHLKGSEEMDREVWEWKGVGGFDEI
eukprot:evm.model.scf_378EXC.1 EVM.evm.TU.scf_378EXC.1   scf_378EXC:15419-16830(+)